MPVLLDLAEHTSNHEFAIHIGDLIVRLDQDGAFNDTQSSVASRCATVVEVAGTLVINAHGGDPIQAAQIPAVFDAFVEGEYRRDIETRRAEHGDDADHPLSRSTVQRSFDALLAVFAAAAGSPEAAKLPEPTVHFVVDSDTGHDTLVHAGIVLPPGDQIELDPDGAIIDETALLQDLTDELADNEGGRTDQHIRAIICEPDNRLKHRERWKIRRDERGRASTLRSDGTIILPVGERPPDLTIDEQHDQTRRRIEKLIADSAVA